MSGLATTEADQLNAEADGGTISKVQMAENVVGDPRKPLQVGRKETRLSLVDAKGSAQSVFGVTAGSTEHVGAQLRACAKRTGLGAPREQIAVRKAAGNQQSRITKQHFQLHPRTDHR